MSERNRGLKPTATITTSLREVYRMKAKAEIPPAVPNFTVSDFVLRIYFEFRHSDVGFILPSLPR